MVVGKAGLADLSSALRKAEQRLGRAGVAQDEPMGSLARSGLTTAVLLAKDTGKRELRAT